MPGGHFLSRVGKEAKDAKGTPVGCFPLEPLSRPPGGAPPTGGRCPPSFSEISLFYALFTLYFSLIRRAEIYIAQKQLSILRRL